MVAQAHIAIRTMLGANGGDFPVRALYSIEADYDMKY